MHKNVIWSLAILILLTAGPVEARTKLAALPERSQVVVRLDNPRATLIEEERLLTLQQGANQVDFAWAGVGIDADSIDLTLLDHQDQVRLVGVNYPPGEAALTWDIHSTTALEVRVRISYLLAFIDRVVAYKGVADTSESAMDLKTFLVLRNFSGEDFDRASLRLGDKDGVEQSVRHEETLQSLHARAQKVPLEKVWTFDSAELPWDPEEVRDNVGIPVSYRLVNDTKSGLGETVLWAGKVRVFQDDGRGGSILLGEDQIPVVPKGEEALIRIGDSRDIVVTQRVMRQQMINIRRNDGDQIVLHDTDEVVEATAENFKDSPARLSMIEHIDGEWDMEETNLSFERLDAGTLKYVLDLPARGKQKLVMHYHRRNIR